MTPSVKLPVIQRVAMPPRYDGKRVNDRWLCAKGHLHPGRGHAVKCQQRTRHELERKAALVQQGGAPPAKRSPATPYFTSKCYACDGPAEGVRDRRPEGGLVEAACARHKDPTIKAYAACIGCCGPRPTLAVDGTDFWHKKCDAEASR